MSVEKALATIKVGDYVLAPYGQGKHPKKFSGVVLRIGDALNAKTMDKVLVEFDDPINSKLERASSWRDASKVEKIDISAMDDIELNSAKYLVRFNGSVDNKFYGVVLSQESDGTYTIQFDPDDDGKPGDIINNVRRHWILSKRTAFEVVREEHFYDDHTPSNDVSDEEPPVSTRYDNYTKIKC